jgi:glycosyltransferase involved in cell wall biosynthesis
MNEISLCMAYYENPGQLRRQIEFMNYVPWNSKENVQFIVVDDGSPEWPARKDDCNVSLEIYRIEVDIRWNQDAARNIAVHESTSPWIFLTDMDHWIPRGTWRWLMYADLDPKKVYRFSRVNEPRMDPYKPHPNTWLMSRKVWDTVGGYDERFAGYYGTDADFRNRVAEAAEIVMSREVVVRTSREVVPDASTTRYDRKTVEDQIGLDQVKLDRAKIPDWRPKTLSFPYHRVV